MTGKIYILLPVHNRVAVTERFIDCLVVQTHSNYHLVLIDDGSTDNTEQMVRTKIKNLTVLKGRGNWWWAGCLQQGITWLAQHGADAQDVVVMANDDITFDADFLQKAMGVLAGLNDAFLLPYLFDEKSGMPQESGLAADLLRNAFETADSPEQINCLSTRGLFMRVSELRKAGGFHPVLLPHYWSDYEFTMRAHRRGVRLCTGADLVVYLDHSQTGYRDFTHTGLIEFLKKVFSKRSVLNPVYHSSFIFLTSPLLYIPINIFKVWRNFFALTARKAKRGLKIIIGRFVLARAARRAGSNLRVIVGASATGQEGWLSTDYPLLDLTDMNSFSALFQRGSVSCFLAEHVWEHLSLEDGDKACRNCIGFLNAGGRLRIAVPDGFHPDSAYISQVQPGGSGPGADDHKVLYTYQTLSRVLEEAGYQVKVLEWFDEKGIFHQEDWEVEKGFVRRSTRFDPRNLTNPTAYTSLIIDAIKP